MSINDNSGGRADVMAAMRDALARSKEESQGRRDRVLAYPDLAKRLTEPPLRLSDPKRWNGWIPPRTLAEDVCGRGCDGRMCRDRPHLARLNDSPYRRQLLDIATEAWVRDQQAADAEKSA